MKNCSIGVEMVIKGNEAFFDDVKSMKREEEWNVMCIMEKRCDAESGWN